MESIHRNPRSPEPIFLKLQTGFADETRMPPQSWSRVIASYVAPRSLTTRTRAALAGLGYRIVPAATRGRFDDDSWEPHIRIVDEKHIDRIPSEPYLPRIPIIRLTGPRPLPCDDPRVVGSIARPATLELLYPILQSALEEHPRRTARAATQIQARCTHADRRWIGALVSLSQEGCLFRTGEAMAKGLELNMLFPLPLGRMISTRARVVNRSGDLVGMQFTAPAGTVRNAVGEYVEGRLATQQPAS